MYKSKTMKKLTAKTCSALLVVSCILGFAVPDVLADNSVNLIGNGDFESGSISPWQQSSKSAKISVDSTVFYPTGSETTGHSLKIENGSTDYSIVAQVIKVNPGQKFAFNTLVKTSNVKAASVSGNNEIAGAFVDITEYDSNNQQISADIHYNFLDTADWKQTAFGFQAPSNAAYAMVSVGINGTGTAWFDNVILQSMDSSSTASISNQRLGGIDRIDTSLKIANQEFSGKAPNAVILTTADNFPDALSGANLAYKYSAPILLVNKTVNDSKNTLDYITSNLTKDKTVYILGGYNAVSKEIQDYLASSGYSNIKRLSGDSRYTTNQLIFNELAVAQGTPVIIATGESFADALSVSSIAAFNGYPILLNGKDGLQSNVKDDIAKLQPSTVYIIGGTGVISDAISNEIAKANSNRTPVRIGGSDRYDTSMKIMDAFNLTSTSLTVATGENFPDALSGSLLAALNKSAILLVNNNDTTKQKEMINKYKISNIFVLGSSGVIKDYTVGALTK